MKSRDTEPGMYFMTLCTHPSHDKHGSGFWYQMPASWRLFHREVVPALENSNTSRKTRTSVSGETQRACPVCLDPVCYRLNYVALVFGVELMPDGTFHDKWRE